MFGLAIGIIIVAIILLGYAVMLLESLFASPSDWVRALLKVDDKEVLRWTHYLRALILLIIYIVIAVFIVMVAKEWWKEYKEVHNDNSENTNWTACLPNNQCF